MRYHTGGRLGQTLKGSVGAEMGKVENITQVESEEPGELDLAVERGRHFQMRDEPESSIG